jgi:transcriptional regulator with XRE-family HTH domain
MRGRPKSGENRLKELAVSAASDSLKVLYMAAVARGLTPAAVAKLLSVKVPTLADYAQALEPRASTIENIAKRLGLGQATLERRVRALQNRLTDRDIAVLERLALTEQNFPGILRAAVRGVGFSNASRTAQSAALRAFALAEAGFDEGGLVPQMALVQSLASYGFRNIGEAMSSGSIAFSDPISEVFALAEQRGANLSEAQVAILNDILMVYPSSATPGTLQREPRVDPNLFVGPLKRSKSSKTPAI